MTHEKDQETREAYDEVYGDDIVLESVPAKDDLEPTVSDRNEAPSSVSPSEAELRWAEWAMREVPSTPAPKDLPDNLDK